LSGEAGCFPCDAAWGVEHGVVRTLVLRDAHRGVAVLSGRAVLSGVAMHSGVAVHSGVSVHGDIAVHSGIAV
jgi:hypothetical protein